MHVYKPTEYISISTFNAKCMLLLSDLPLPLIPQALLIVKVISAVDQFVCQQNGAASVNPLTMIIFSLP